MCLQQGLTLEGCRIANSRLKSVIPIFEDSMCAIRAEYSMSKLIAETFPVRISVTAKPLMSIELNKLFILILWLWYPETENR